MSDLSFARGLKRSLAAVAVLVGVATVATAAPCPSTGLSDGPPLISRIMDATGPTPVPPGTDQTACYAYGSGNVNGNIAQDPLLNGQSMGNNTFYLDANSPLPALKASLGEIAFAEKVDAGQQPGTYVTFTGTQSGTFSILQPFGSYANLIVALKMGGGNDSVEPEWFSWVIPNEVATYNWSWVTGKETGLSHINVYGAVPLPAAAWLMLAGLGGLGLMSRRRKAA